MSDRKRSLNELRVIDLRCELEKRNLDKSGVRGVLIQRLSKYLEEEGEDPATYKFELGADVKTPAKRTRRSESTVEPEAEDTPAMEDMIVQDDVGEEEETEAQEKKTTDEDQETMETEENEKATRKREYKNEPTEDEATEAKKPCLDNNEIKNDDDQKIDNTDAEDSINLDLGEDELLNEETDNTSKPKKDEAGGEAATRGEGAGEARREDAGRDEPPRAEPAPAASSNEAEPNDVDKKDDKDKDSEGDKKEKKDDSKEGGARNLWVSGLSGDTRAKDLKQLCSKYGKVIGAKVVTNAKTPGSRCYGYVTMASAQDAENCIKNLHRTELHGRMISVEKAKSESETSRRQLSRNERRSSKDQKDEAKENEDGKEDGEKGDVKEEVRSASHTREKSSKSDKDRRRSTRSRERRRSPREVLSFSKILKERDVARARERSRAAREEERRRRAAEDALRERERRQRQEKHRLALERDKLRAEREKIEREKNELLRLERERHRLEREKLELERLELKRAQLRLEEERRKRGYESSAYRKAPSPPPEPYDRHKRAPPPQSSTRQFEAPPPPRFELGASYERGDKRDYKREYPPRHTSTGNIKYPSNGSTNDDPRQQVPSGVRPKEPSRSYESREARSYRAAPPAKPEPRWAASQRYAAQPPPAKGSSGGAGAEAWSGEARYGSYAPRYPQYQPPPPGVYDQQRDYARKY